MANQSDLQTILETRLGSRNVYFQPPESIKMNYPAIVYSRKRINTTFADNTIYKHDTAYEVVLIDKDPNSQYLHVILGIPHCSFDTHYVKDNLNHDVFTIFI